MLSVTLMVGVKNYCSVASGGASFATIAFLFALFLTYGYELLFQFQVKLYNRFTRGVNMHLHYTRKINKKQKLKHNIF